MVFVNRKGRKPLSAFAFTVFPAQRVWTAMAAKEPLDEDPLNNIKSVVTNLVEGIFHDFGKNVLNKEELRKIKKDVNLIVNNTENLVEDIIEKTEKASKLFANHFKSSKKQLRLKFHPENDDESEKSSTPSSPSTASEDENEESRDEENTLSAETLAISPVESRKKKKKVKEMKENADVAKASVLKLIVPQETHSARSEDALKLCPPDHFDKLKTEKADEIYPVMKKEGRTRLALIICNKTFDSLSNRNGADIDLLRMQDLLNDLGYSVIVKVNLTAQGMETELRRFADHEGHQSSDSTFLVFMSHGILDGICGTKHSINKPDILHDDTIFTIFNNHNCKNLRNKPKIIIMQACRGRGDGIVWVTTERGEAMADTHSLPMQYYGYYGRSDAVTMTHIEKDFIAFKSSTPHNVSWILDTGSLFISQLIYFIKEYCWSHHLEEIFRMVQRSFETPTKLTQMPTIERVSMTRYFYLFPGN